MKSNYGKLIEAYMQVICESDDAEKIIADFQREATKERKLQTPRTVALVMKDGTVKLLCGGYGKKYALQVMARSKTLRGKTPDLHSYNGSSKLANSKSVDDIPIADVDHVVDPRAEAKRVSTAEELEAAFAAHDGTVIVLRQAREMGHHRGGTCTVVRDRYVLPVDETSYCLVYDGELDPNWESRGSELDSWKKQIVGTDVPLKSYNECMKEVDDAHDAEVAKQAEGLTEDDVCHSWGYLNGDPEGFEAASYKHDQMMKEHPEQHKMTRIQNGSCDNTYRCTCGFSYSVDSSD